MAEKVNLPVLRFPEFREAWVKKKIKDIGYFYYGKSAPKWSISDDAPTPCVRYGELYSTYGEYIKEIKSYTNIDPKTLKFSKGGEVLVPRVGEDPLDFANCSFLPMAGIAIGEMISVFNTEENGVFLTYYFNTMLKKAFARVVEGGSVSNLYYKYLEPITLHIPSYQEQEQIAKLLSTLDEKIIFLENKKSRLEEYKKGIMQKIFSREVRFKKDDGSEYPKWEKKKWKDIGYFYYGKSAPKWSISDDAPTPCVRYGELYSTYGEYIKEIKSYTNIDPKTLKFSKGGEVLVPRVGEDPLDFANCSFLPMAGIAIGEMISVFNTEENGLYLVYYINSSLKKEIARLVEGGSVSNLYFRYLEEITIELPCREEQKEIADFIQAIQKEVDTIKESISKTLNYKKGLLQGLFI